MDHIKLYKEKRALQSPSRQSRRSLHAENRSKRRHELFCHGRRDLSSDPSPAAPTEPRHLHAVTRITEENEPPRMHSRRADFMRRFAAWKERKEQEKKAKQSKPSRPPFVPVGNGGGGGYSVNSSCLAPKNHKFKPPVGLKNPAMESMKNAFANEVRLLVGGKKPKITISKKTKTNLNTKCALVERQQKFTSEHKVLPLLQQPQLPPIMPSAAIEKPPPRNQIVLTKTTRATKVKDNPATRPSKATMTTIIPTIKISKAVTKAKEPTSTVIANDKKKTSPADAAHRSTGAIGKAKLLQQQQQQQFVADDRKKKPQAKLATTSMKAKKPHAQSAAIPMKTNSGKATASTAVAAGKKKNARILLIVNALKEGSLLTPIDSHDGNAQLKCGKNLPPIKNQKFVTSTQLRPSSAPRNLNAFTPKESPKQLERRSTKMTATKKFNFLCEDPNVSVTASPPVCSSKNTPYKTKPMSAKKKRPSAAAVVERIELKAKASSPSGERSTLDAVGGFRQQLSNQIERLHALCDDWESHKSQLQAECGADGDSGGGGGNNADVIDAIDAAIGQTRLLTSKKFMQFKGLIDRCEQGAKGVAPPDDGSEATKPIRAIDLEGFWSMLDIQIFDLDERFKKLERCRSNNWTTDDDDDAKKLTRKKNLVAKKKKQPTKDDATTNTTTSKTSKSNGGFHQMMRRILKETMKKQPFVGVGGADNSFVPISPALTPSTQQRRQQQRRVSLLVRDRKSRSIAPTLLTVQTPQRHRLTIMSPAQQVAHKNGDVDDLKRSPAIKMLNRSVNKSQERTTFNAANGRSIVRNANTANITQQQALEAAGASNTSSSSSSSSSSPLATSLSPSPLVVTSGMYNLRGRTVKLRPSDEIVIPR